MFNGSWLQYLNLIFVSDAKELETVFYIAVEYSKEREGVAFQSTEI